MSFEAGPIAEYSPKKETSKNHCLYPKEHVIQYFSYCRNNKLLKGQSLYSIFLTLKGTVQQDFRPPVFFHNSNRPRPLTNGLKYFFVLVSFSPRYSNFSESPRSTYHMYCEDSSNQIWGEISKHFHTVRSQAPCSMILHRKNWLCAESLYTARSQRPLLKTFAQAFKWTMS